MANIHRELDRLRYDIQREKATLRALQRQIKRVNGKEVIYSSSEQDTARILANCGSVPDDTACLRTLETMVKNDIDDMRHQVAVLKHELETRMPLTPCGMVAAIVRAKRKRKKQLQSK